MTPAAMSGLTRHSPRHGYPMPRRLARIAAKTLELPTLPRTHAAAALVLDRLQHLHRRDAAARPQGVPPRRARGAHEGGSGLERLLVLARCPVRVRRVSPDGIREGARVRHRLPDRR